MSGPDKKVQVVISRDREHTGNGNRYGWFSVLVPYVSFVAVISLAWEILQLPFYTIWREGSASEIAFAVAHCTIGDLLIALSALVVALILARDAIWPKGSYARVAMMTVIFGVLYTVFSEWVNVELRQGWAYSDLMPVIPIIGTGLSPVAQWLVIPLAGIWWVRRRTVSVNYKVRESA
ncbi:MAG: hypothetical protein ACE5H7_17410 [Acidiferrobacterales bacterium]